MIIYTLKIGIGSYLTEKGYAPKLEDAVFTDSLTAITQWQKDGPKGCRIVKVDTNLIDFVPLYPGDIAEAKIGNYAAY